MQQLEAVGAKFDTGKVVQHKCDGCHSALAPGIAEPEKINAHLASQHSSYTTKQLHDYRNKLRVESKSRMSSSSLIGLTDNVIEEIARHYENLAIELPNDKSATELFIRGQNIYMTRIFANGLPSCAGCHGLNGEGSKDALIPRITGSYRRYTESQLQYFKSGERSNDPHGVMRAVSANLTRKEIEDLAYFIRQMR